MSEGPRFEQTLERLLRVFEAAGVRHALIGGLAVATWGAPRATEDIDVLAGAARSSSLDETLRQAGFEPEWRYGGADDPVPLLLRLRSPGGLPEIDVVCATRDWEREILGRAVRVRILDGPEVPVVALEDLIVLKLLAGGPHDLADVADLLTRSGPLPELDGRAAERGVLDLLRRLRESII